jgi:predicted peptidase
MFAAAIFVCSIGAPLNRAANVTRLPVWAFQGSEDKPGVTATRNMIKAIRKAGGHPRYTEYSGAGHEIWNRVFKEPGLVEWLFSQHR